jgi:hypothetical protein
VPKGDAPGFDRLIGVGGPQHHHVWHRPQASDLLHRLIVNGGLEVHKNGG